MAPSQGKYGKFCIYIIERMYNIRFLYEGKKNEKESALCSIHTYLSRDRAIAGKRRKKKEERRKKKEKRKKKKENQPTPGYVPNIHKE
jgi:hypothetical protein